MKKKNDILNPIKELAKDVDMGLVNKMLQTTELKDFEMNKQTITNIAEWCLNGESDNEIRQRLALTKNQWQILVNICPVLLIIMKDSRALADVVIAGSLFQTAIGGQRIRKQQPVRVKEYNEKGVVIGEHYEIFETSEELPPNPMLLKFLAEHKMSEKLGDTQLNNQNSYREIVENLTPEERALIEAYKQQAGNLNGK